MSNRKIERGATPPPTPPGFAPNVDMGPGGVVLDDGGKGRVTSPPPEPPLVALSPEPNYSPSHQITQVPLHRDCTLMRMMTVLRQVKFYIFYYYHFIKICPREQMNFIRREFPAFWLRPCVALCSPSIGE